MLPKMTTIFDGPMRVIGPVEGRENEYELQHLLWNKTERAHVKMLKRYIAGAVTMPPEEVALRTGRLTEVDAIQQHKQDFVNAAEKRKNARGRKQDWFLCRRTDNDVQWIPYSAEMLQSQLFLDFVKHTASGSMFQRNVGRRVGRIRPWPRIYRRLQRCSYTCGILRR